MFSVNIFSFSMFAKWIRPVPPKRLDSTSPGLAEKFWLLGIHTDAKHFSQPFQELPKDHRGCFKQKRLQASCQIVGQFFEDS